MGKTNLTTLESLIHEFLKRRGIGDKLQFVFLKRNWSSILGENIGNHSKPLRIEAKTLIVGVDDPIWANELSLRNREITDRVKKWIDRNGFDIEIERIRFYVK